LETYRISNLTFTYPNRAAPALDNINLTLAQGDFCVLCGHSGGGKTTLLRHLKPAIMPHGTREGEILFNGTPVNDLAPRDAAAKIGYVSQNIENQIVTDKVWHELAFGLESLGLPTPQIRLRTAETACFLGMQAWFERDTHTLSGGQKQRLILGSILTMHPDVLILDEPTSQLDPIAAEELFTLLAKINRELGVTVILTEHRPEEAFPLANKIIVLDNGCIIYEDTPRNAPRNILGILPTPMRIFHGIGASGTCPVTIKEGRKWLKTQTLKPIPPVQEPPPVAPALILRDIYFKYEKNAPDVLTGVSFTANKGEITALLGGNGTGKSTTLAIAMGLYKPRRGKITAHGKITMLPQNPTTLFIGKTVQEDLHEMTQNLDELEHIVRQCRLQHLLDIHPYDLSGGEQQRTALAKVLLTRPQILLLDEPTQGLDTAYKQNFAEILRSLANTGVAIVLVSHDIEFCAEYADRCALFFNGSIITQSTTRAFFANNHFYTTGANRMTRGLVENAVTATDVINALQKGSL